MNLSPLSAPAISTAKSKTKIKVKAKTKTKIQTQTKIKTRSRIKPNIQSKANPPQQNFSLPSSKSASSIRLFFQNVNGIALKRLSTTL